MKELEVAVPWNLPNYFAGNGFHPLYRAWFDLGVEINGARLNILDEPALVDHLVGEPDWLQWAEACIARLERQLSARWAKYEAAADFICWSTPANLWLTEHLPGQVELHHTCPLTTGTRPFFLHCESFLPTFMPFSFQGRGAMRTPEAVKKFYGALLAGDTCLGIFSHLQVTLDQFSHFFRNSSIEGKLCLAPIGLGERTFRELGRVDRQQLPRNPLFLFSGSAHRNPGNLRARGLYTSLLFWEALRSQHPASRLVLSCARPTGEELKAAALDLSRLRADEQSGRLLWIEGYLPEAEQLNLFKQADFYLLPSANLHSVSIMQAQLSGAIPIVTDAYGTERYVRDGTTGIVLEGARQKVWSTDPKTGIPVDDHTLIDRSFMRAQAEQMLSRVTAQLMDQDAFLSLRTNTQAHARREYDGKVFREFVFEKMISLAPENGRIARVTARTFPVCNDSRIKKLFATPPHPLQILDTGHLQVFTSAGTYTVRGPANPAERAERGRLSAIDLAASRLKGRHTVAIVWEMPELGERLLPNPTLSQPEPVTKPPKRGRSWPNRVVTRVLSKKFRHSVCKRLATLSTWCED